MTCAYYCRSHFSLGSAIRENSQDRAMILKSWRRASHCARHEWRSDSADYADVSIDRYLPETIGCTPVDEGHRSERRMFPVHSGRWFAIRKSQQSPIQDGHVPWGARISSACQTSTRSNLFTVPDTICKIRERNRRCVVVTQNTRFLHPARARETTKGERHSAVALLWKTHKSRGDSSHQLNESLSLRCAMKCQESPPRCSLVGVVARTVIGPFVPVGSSITPT
jgi:hypothetical protein